MIAVFAISEAESGAADAGALRMAWMNGIKRGNDGGPIIADGSEPTKDGQRLMASGLAPIAAKRSRMV